MVGTWRWSTMALGAVVVIGIAPSVGKAQGWRDKLHQVTDKVRSTADTTTTVVDVLTGGQAKDTAGAKKGGGKGGKQASAGTGAASSTASTGSASTGSASSSKANTSSTVLTEASVKSVVAGMTAQRNYLAAHPDEPSMATATGISASGFSEKAYTTMANRVGGYCRYSPTQLSAAFKADELKALDSNRSALMTYCTTPATSK